MRRQPLHILGAATLAAGLATANPALAQVVSVDESDVLAPAEEPARLADPALTLSEAVDLAIAHNPAIDQQAAVVRAALGRQQETRGLFDPILRISPSASFDYKEMAPSLVSREINKRETIRIIANNFTALTLGLREMIEAEAGRAGAPPRCPEGILSNGQLDLTGANLDLSGRDPLERELLGVETNLQSVVVELGDGIDLSALSSICRSEPREILAPEFMIDAFRRIDQSGGLGLEGILQSVAQIPRETRILQEQIARTVALRAKLALDRLGPLAKDELKRNITIDTSLSKLFRNGLLVTGDFQVQSQEHNFVDKPLDPTFGGLETPPQFFSQASGSVTVPLGRGRGGAATAANARAAERMVEAEREQFRHLVAEEVFRTVLAYLNVVAAEQTVAQLEESLTRQQQILTLSEGQVTAGELAQADLARVRASSFAIESSLAQARSALLTARLGLADQIGLEVTSLDDAPVAAEGFATVAPTTGEVEAFIDQALASRHDIRAATARREAADALTAGARAAARPRLDLTFTAGIFNLEDSPFFKYLTDEADPIISVTSGLPTGPVTGSRVPPEDPVRYFNPIGFGRAVGNRHTPFATVTLALELPFGNNAAKGRLAQAESASSSAAIQSQELRRVVGDSIVDLVHSLERSAAALAERESAVARNAETLDGQLQMFQIGDSTLIDVLLTEDGFTGDNLELIRLRQAYLGARARLQYELGRLVTVDTAGAGTPAVQFDPATFTR